MRRAISVRAAASGGFEPRGRRRDRVAHRFRVRDGSHVDRATQHAEIDARHVAQQRAQRDVALACSAERRPRFGYRRVEAENALRNEVKSQRGE